MPIQTILPREAHKLLEKGALLIDVRASDEHAREHVQHAKARNVPMERLAGGTLAADGAPALIFHCRSGNRTRMNAARLEACSDGSCKDIYVLEGGLDAWIKAGLPVARDASQPLELQRQVQIGAGSMVVLGVVLGMTVSPWFLALSGFVGAGLVFAGVSGFCGLARLLVHMPWNRRAMTG